MTTCKRYGLPVVNPIGPDGRFLDDVPQVGGQFFKDADEGLTADLRERGLLYRGSHFEHSYPHCWRCHTALLYYALPAWYIRTTSIKDQLLAENEKTSWYPETIKWGRFGEWLRNNVDWSLSRSRYWGTPLPLWVCSADESHVTCVGSLAELSELSGQDVSGLDPHRPYVDDVVLPCPSCGAEARRVPDVIDAWYDSGSMPFAQWGAPYQNPEMLETAYPAQFICEGTDQTRGWFYSLMAVGTLVFGRSSYENVLCLGLILAEDGRKMSKHLGNVLQPIPLMEQHGADALRWFMACSGSPWAARRVGHAALEEIVRKVLLTYWNTASFFTLYAGAESWAPSMIDQAPAYGERPLIDRWALAELHRTVAEVTSSMDEFDTARVGRRLAEFLDDLSNWYVRRSRRRFWSGDVSAFATLYECLETVTRLMAPVVPFTTDYVWDVLREEGSPSSVHLASWPQVNSALLDPALSEQMALVRRLVELGRSARASSGVKTRQPLGRALVGAPGWAALSAELRGLIAEELNVQALEDLSGFSADLVSFTVKPNFRALGKRFGSQTKLVAAAVAAADAGELARALRAGSPVSLEAGELGTVELTGEDVIVTEQPKSGWAVETGAVDTGTGETVALDLAITDELRRSGLIRDVIRLVQEARKTTGLAITDRIDLWWSTDDADLAEALRAQGGVVADEVLALSVTEGAAEEVPSHQDSDLGLTFQLRRATA
nr:hypothetical protein GCM10020093_115270 [Planobispora longispora]